VRGRAETIIAQLSQANASLAARVPELEAPAESPSAATNGVGAADEQQGRGQPHSDAPGAQEGARRPWWRRVFRS